MDLQTMDDSSQVPCATTLCVVNLQQTEAKVESIFDSFVSLRQETSGAGPGTAEGNDLFMFDDDDNYQVDVTYLANQLV